MSAHPATYARGASEALVPLCVGADVDPHLAVRAAVPARDTHVLLHPDVEAAELLEEAHDRCHGAEVAAPDARPQQRIDSDTDDARQDRAGDKCVDRLHL